MIEKVDPLFEVGVCVLGVRGCASARGWLSTVLVGGRLSRNHAQLAMLMPTPFRMICSVSEFLMLWFGTLVGVAVCCLVLVSLATCFCVHLSGHGVCEMDASAPLCFSRASEKGWFRLSPLLITILGVEGMFQTYDGVLDSVLHVWLHVACVAHSEQGYVTSAR